jgi:hypothetical protein
MKEARWSGYRPSKKEMIAAWRPVETGGNAFLRDKRLLPAINEGGGGENTKWSNVFLGAFIRVQPFCADLKNIQWRFMSNSNSYKVFITESLVKKEANHLNLMSIIKKSR